MCSPSRCPLPVELCGLHLLHPATMYDCIHRVLPTMETHHILASRVFIDAWSHRRGSPPAWLTLVSIPSRDWIDIMCFKAHTINHTVSRLSGMAQGPQTKTQGLRDYFPGTKSKGQTSLWAKFILYCKWLLQLFIHSTNTECLLWVTKLSPGVHGSEQDVSSPLKEPIPSAFCSNHHQRKNMPRFSLIDTFYLWRITLLPMRGFHENCSNILTK